MSNLNLRTPNVQKLVTALQIATQTINACNGDLELLTLVVQQLAASTGVQLGGNISSQQGTNQSGRSSGRRSRRSSRSRSRGGSPGPKTGGAAQQPPQQVQGPAPNVNNPQPPQNVAVQPQVQQQPGAQPRAPLVDESGTSKTTWKSRIKGSRQRALEAFAAFKIRASQRTAAIFCNAYWTLSEQTQRFKATPFWTDNTADPLRDLPLSGRVETLAAALDTSEDPQWRRGENRHFIIQDQDGKSLRGEDIFTQFLQ